MQQWDDAMQASIRRARVNANNMVDSVRKELQMDVLLAVKDAQLKRFKAEKNAQIEQLEAEKNAQIKQLEAEKNAQIEQLQAELARVKLQAKGA